MSENTVVTRSLEIVTAEIHTIERNARRVFLDSVIQIGTRLEEAKQLVQPGGWLKYLNEELGYKPTTAQNYMRLAREFGNAQVSLTGKDPRELFGELSYSQLMPLIGLSEEEREEIAEENDLPAMSSREIAALVKERDELKGRNESLGTEVTKLKTQAEESQKSLEDEKTKTKRLGDEMEENRSIMDALREEKCMLEKIVQKPRELTEEELAEMRREIAGEQGKALEEAQRRADEADARLEKLKNPAAHKVNFLFGEMTEEFSKLKAAVLELEETDAQSAQRMRGAINEAVRGWRI